MMNTEVVVAGAGGHAKVVIATLRAAGVPVAAAFDDDARKYGEMILGVPVEGPLKEMERAGLPAIAAVGDNAARKRAVDALDVEWARVVHPYAWVAPDVHLGGGAVVFAGAVIQPGAVIGDHVIVNTGATIDHDCVVGAYAHVGPGANVAGGVRVSTGAFLGTGSSVVPRVQIGEWTMVGAGAAVTRNLPARVVAKGVPARWSDSA